jgi:hypothetical protein
VRQGLELALGPGLALEPALVLVLGQVLVPALGWELHSQQPPNYQPKP